MRTEAADIIREIPDSRVQSFSVEREFMTDSLPRVRGASLLGADRSEAGQQIREVLNINVAVGVEVAFGVRRAAGRAEVCEQDGQVGQAHSAVAVEVARAGRRTEVCNPALLLPRRIH